MRVIYLQLLSATVLLFTLTACGSSNSSEITGRTEVESRGYPWGETMPELAMELTTVSDNPEYGFSQEHPVMVGGFDLGDTPRNTNQIQFLSSLTGPNGEMIYFERAGSCCHYPSENGIMGYGALDVYKVIYEGLEEPLVLYLTLYDYDEPRIPKGFSSVELQR